MGIKLNTAEMGVKIKTFLTKMVYYSIIAISLGVGFTVGFYYNTIKEIKLTKVDKRPKVLTKSEITLAVDEKNNILLINKADGSYFTLEDSVGYNIFNLEARILVKQPPAVVSDKK